MIAISLGLVGLTSLGGVALSKGHDAIFAPTVLATPLAPAASQAPQLQVTRSVAPVTVQSSHATVQLASLSPRIDLRERGSLAPDTALRPVARTSVTGHDSGDSVLVAALPVRINPLQTSDSSQTLRGGNRRTLTIAEPKPQPRFLIGVYR